MPELKRRIEERAREELKKQEEARILEKKKQIERIEHMKSFRLALIILFVMQVFMIIIYGTCTKTTYMGEDFGKVYQMVCLCRFPVATYMHPTNLTLSLP